MIVIAAVTTANQVDQQAVVLIWRMLTYYFVLFISFGANAIFEALSSHRIIKEAKEKDVLEETSNDESV